MHSILPITVTTALCLLTFPSASSSSTPKGVDIFLQRGQQHPEDNQGKVRYADNGKSITLKCFGKLDGDSNVHLEWFKNNESLSLKCASQDPYIDIDKETGKEVKMQRCQLINSTDEKLSEMGRSLTLQFNKLLRDDFGIYECKGIFAPNLANEEHVKHQVKVWETITATRKKESGKRLGNLLVHEGDDFQIFCNFTGLRKDLKIRWYKDKKDITKDLLAGTGNFTCKDSNETEAFDGNNLCVRVAKINEHRGDYTCEVSRDPIEDDNFSSVSHTYFIRVKAKTSILYPGIILVVETIILGIITIITWKNTSTGDQLDGNDWEDDDENDPENREEQDDEDEELTSKPLTGG